MIITGTGVFTLAGVTSPASMLTSIAGNVELSTRPVSFFTTTGMPPSVSFVVDVTSHVTFGTFFGTRPSTSRSKSSTISGRRSFVHIAAVVTFWPLFSVSTSGRSGYGLAVASS